MLGLSNLPDLSLRQYLSDYAEVDGGGAEAAEDGLLRDEGVAAGGHQVAGEHRKRRGLACG